MGKIERPKTIQVNMRKTKVVIFGTRGMSGAEFRLDASLELIKEASEYRYLGLWFDKTGTWAKSKRIMVARAKRAMVIGTSQLTQERSFSLKTQENIWNGLIRPHLEYYIYMRQRSWMNQE